MTYLFAFEIYEADIKFKLFVYDFVVVDEKLNVIYFNALDTKYIILFTCIYADCLHEPIYSPLRGDTFYNFKCASCGQDGEEEYERAKMSW